MSKRFSASRRKHNKWAGMKKGNLKPSAFFFRLAIVLFFGFCLTGDCDAQEERQSPFPSQPTIDAMWGYRPATNYLVLPRAATVLNKKDPNTAIGSKAVIVSQPTQPYAYGWFGTKPSPKWSRQFGSQNAYTQWTLK